MAWEIAIPEDVVETEILTRLPVKSLLRFKCVCKSWYTIINNPSFISANSMFHQNNNPCLLIKGDFVNCRGWNFLSEKTLQPVSKMYFPVDEDINYGRILGSSSINGIFCALIKPSATYLLNPATRELMLIPPSDSLFLPEGYTFYYKGFGFGYDAKLDDYKVVRTLKIIDAFGNRGSPENYPFAEIYNLRTNCWRKLYSKTHWSVDQYGGEFLNGMFHWKAKDKTHQLLLSFDMSTDSFHATYMLGRYHTTKMFEVFSLNGSIAVTTLDKTLAMDEMSLEVWVLGEIGEEKSWTKRFTIDSLRVPYPMGYWRNGVIFIIITSDIIAKVVCYDLYTRIIRDLDLEVHSLILHVLRYSESLVPLLGRIHQPQNFKINRIGSWSIIQRFCGDGCKLQRM